MMAVFTMQKVVHELLILLSRFLVNDDFIIFILYDFEETVLLNDSKSCILNI